MNAAATQITNFNNAPSSGNAPALSTNSGATTSQSPHAQRIVEDEGRKDLNLNRALTANNLIDSCNVTPRSLRNQNNSNIVLTNGAMTDIEGSNNLMTKEMVDIVRTSSPANEYRRSPHSSFGFSSNDCDSTAAAVLSLAEPAAGAFATPHNSGKYIRSTSTLPSYVDGHTAATTQVTNFNSAASTGDSLNKAVEAAVLTGVSEKLEGRKDPDRKSSDESHLQQGKELGSGSGQLKGEDNGLVVVDSASHGLEETRAPTSLQNIPTAGGVIDAKAASCSDGKVGTGSGSSPCTPSGDNDRRTSSGQKKASVSKDNNGIEGSLTQQEEHRRRASGNRWSPLSTITTAVNSTMGSHIAIPVSSTTATPSVAALDSTVHVRSMSERTDSDLDVVPTRERSATDATGDDNDPADVTTFENVDEDFN